MASLGYVKALRRWRVRWRATDRKTHYVFAGSRVFLEKSQAVNFYAEIEAQEKLVRSGQVVPSESIDVVVQNFYKHIKRHTPRTQDHYRMVIRLFTESLHKSVIRIHQITHGHIQEYIYRHNYKDKRVKNRTLNAHLTVIKAFCRFYSEQFNIANPATKVKMLTEDPPDNRFITKAEYQKLLDVAPPLAKNRIIFLANTGLRASEFASLMPNSLYGRSITIIGKGRRRRTIPLNKSVQAILPHVQLGSRKALIQQFSKLAQKADIPSFGPNALRHYFGTQLLLNGVPIAKVAKLMGNSVRVIEKHYAHILTADVADATNVLDNL